MKALAKAHIAELDGKIRLLEEMRATLGALAAACDGDHRPHCPIITSLETGEALPDIKGRPNLHENLAHHSVRAGRVAATASSAE